MGGVCGMQLIDQAIPEPSRKPVAKALPSESGVVEWTKRVNCKYPESRFVP